MDSAALIFNPHAGSLRRRLAPERAAALLRRQGFAVELRVTSRAGEAVELAALAAERHPIVVAAGGDGTCREVAAGLLGTPAALAVLPCGTGNDFAAGLGLRSPEAGAAAAGRREVCALDVGFLAGRPFVNSAGLFLSGEVSRRAGRLPTLAGRLRYVLGAAGAALAHRPPVANWHLDGETGAREGAWTLAEIGNGPRTGGCFHLTPHADPCDGLLDFCLVEAVGLVTMARLMPRAVAGTHLRHARVRCPRAASASLELSEAVWIHLDGEPQRLTAGRHAVRVAPGGLRVLARVGAVPRAARAGEAGA